jgi:hypothetical protein
MSKYSWSRGHIGRFWSPNDYRNLNYVKKPARVTDTEMWVNQGYDYVKSFTGSMYDNTNVMPEWVHSLPMLNNYKNVSFTFYKMQTLEIMPTHSDHYDTYCTIFNTTPDKVCRILLMVEDWKPGHYLEIDGTGIVNWIAGDYFIWDEDCPHASSNIGIDDRYTLQITAEKVDSDDVWKKLHWYNFPDLRTKNESCNAPFMKHLRSHLSKVHEPHYIYMYNQHITELDKITHSPDVVDYLNQIGVRIYLYEPLCSYKANARQISPPFGTKHDRWFYSEFTGKESAYELRADELDSILDYINRNNLTNVAVHTCDYDIENWYPYYTNKMKLICDDLFVKTCIPIKLDNVDPSPDFTKKFICVNWRYAPHRHLLAAAVAPLNSYVSWYFRADIATISVSSWYNMHEWSDDDRKKVYYELMLNGIQHLTRNAPMNLDLQVQDAVSITDMYFMKSFPEDIIYSSINEDSATGVTEITNGLEQFYRDAFVDIVTESRFAQPTANYSEKVYQPMHYLKPFVLAAPVHTLKFLKEQGFKTFAEFWDESYDSIENSEERLFAIFDVIDGINSKSIEELRELYNKMLPILHHNRQVVQSILGR